MAKNEMRTIVETGTFDKSDGGFTLVAGEWAKQNDAVVYSIDLELDWLKRQKHVQAIKNRFVLSMMIAWTICNFSLGRLIFSIATAWI